jgi:hypothetical protein
VSILDNKFYWLLSGADIYIIKECDQKTQNSFTILGVSVFAILISCLVASWHSFGTLFQSNIIGFIVALFFASVIFNLYLLLQTTISRNFLPSPLKYSIVKKFGSRLSLTIRLFFIVFLSIVTAKPIETFFFNKELEIAIGTFKQSQKDAFKRHVETLYSTEIQKISNELEKEKQLLVFQTAKENKRIQKLSIALGHLKEKQINELSRLNALIDRSDYFIQRIRLLSTVIKSSWIITFLFTCLFLLPILMKFYISGKESRYYTLKCEKDATIILEHYEFFKKKYAGIFKTLTGKNIEYEETYEEAPFNTRRKQDSRDFKKEEELIRSVYDR